ncbi:hypothetical protein Ddye_023978 [Dipteronia dyeriana]|uniref:Uncharacterized protein n=1 Tax=Dipteronia dyeriana TaxID=168575 RepID=A0AAD9TTX0_9ROSI|nr:hypothetical protein Ddye_023978 [Dipteronia dyeriana]
MPSPPPRVIHHRRARKLHLLLNTKSHLLTTICFVDYRRVGRSDCVGRLTICFVAVKRTVFERKPTGTVRVDPKTVMGLGWLGMVLAFGIGFRERSRYGVREKEAVVIGVCEREKHSGGGGV